MAPLFDPSNTAARPDWQARPSSAPAMTRSMAHLLCALVACVLLWSLASLSQRL